MGLTFIDVTLNDIDIDHAKYFNVSKIVNILLIDIIQKFNSKVLAPMCGIGSSSD